MRRWLWPITLSLLACTPEPRVEQNSYADWLARDNHATQVAAYQQFLTQSQAAGTLPMPQLLSNQRDFARCGAQPWVVPPKEHWPNMLPALAIAQVLAQQGLLHISDVVTSSYRDESLNRCAGGSAKSKHLTNHALDVQLQGADAVQRYADLCTFWRQNGAKLNFGLGFYSDQQVHIDGAGWRTWGADYTRKSSPCNAD
ncbi:MAG: D-Ala-D-Ala carboxypeptidase family metallohydrolase [Formosimonas sp.]